jgi:hypothetical protein
MGPKKKGHENRLIVGSLVIATTIIACRDVDGPIVHTIPVPVHVSRSGVAAPDSTFIIPADRGWPPIKFFIMNFPWDTWVTLESPGTVYLNAKTKLDGASSNYVFPSRPVGATGGVDNHTDGVCYLGLTLQDGYGALPSFGLCGASVKIDTLLSKKLQTPWITRGPLPVRHYYECSTWSDVCHYLNTADYSTVRERPVPVTLAKRLWASAATPDTLYVSPIDFKASFTPDSITVGGGKAAHPYHVTLWQWIGADSTRDPVLTGPGKGPGCASTLLCTYKPPESGRMTVKVFVGGWEQTSSVTVQCLVNPGDSALNDSTNDFLLRTVLQQALEHADTGAIPGANYDPVLKRGSRHETGGINWRLPNGAGFQSVEYDDPRSTQCNYHYPHNPTPPVSGATVESYFHTHSTNPGEDYYACFDSVNIDGRWVKQPRYSGDPDATPGVPHTVGPDVGGGSEPDWGNVQMGKAEYIIHKADSTRNGYAAKLAPFIIPDQNPNIWNVFGPKAGKCTWVK